MIARHDVEIPLSHLEKCTRSTGIVVVTVTNENTGEKARAFLDVRLNDKGEIEIITTVRAADGVDSCRAVVAEWRRSDWSKS